MKVEQRDRDQPPELPADRKKKKKKKEKDGNKSGAAALGSKLKKLYKQKKSSSEPGLSKVSSAPSFAGLEQSSSSGVFNKIGDKLKLIKRAKNSDPKFTDEEVVISSSEYDADGTCDDIESTKMSIPFEDIVYIDSSSSVDQPDESSDHHDPYEDTAPPLPPRGTGTSDEDDLAPPPPPKMRSSMMAKNVDANLGLAVPQRPPKRNSRPQSEEEGSTPALPPRNRGSASVNLDMVVPIYPGLINTAHSTEDVR